MANGGNERLSEAAKSTPSPIVDRPQSVEPPKIATDLPTPALHAEAPERANVAVGLRRGLPAWLVSLLVHMGLLLGLALCTISSEKKLTGIYVLAAEVETEEQALEELTEFEIENVALLEELPEWSLAMEVLDPGAIAFGDLSEMAAVESDVDVAALEVPLTTVDEIGALFGKDGKGMAEIGDGMKAAASFFGAKSRGRRFVFVVDNSNSMTKGRFETALNELMRTIDAMSPRQQFYVIFFSDSAYRMLHPNPAPGLMTATPRNKEMVRAWLYTVQMCLRTQGQEAVKAALALNPDVIYILGDGAFTDDTTEMLTASHQRPIPIHTVGMEVDPKGEGQLKSIAAANNGTYRLVQARPEARLSAQQNPIARNRSRGRVWGLALPLVASEKKPGKKKKRKP